MLKTEELTLAACNGTSAVALVKGKIRGVSALAPGCAPMVTTYPLPPGGRTVIGLDAQGPGVICSDGTFWLWSPPGRPSGAWEKIGSVHDEVQK
jgi:hypothetical protein